MAMCKPDLVAAVLKQLGHEIPPAKTLTKVVFEAAKQLRVQNGLNPTDCTLLVSVNPKSYKGGIRKSGIKV